MNIQNTANPNKPLLLSSKRQSLETNANPLNSSTAHWSTDSSQKQQPESDFFNLNLFCTVLNKTDVICCSRKKPDEFLRDLLFKLLKYCKNFLSTMNHLKPEEKKESSGHHNNFNQNFTIDNRTDKSDRLINLGTAQLMYQSAEFKSILNESQELQHLNLYFLKTDNQKLSFFINLYNLLCIHSQFYLASTRTSKPEPSLPVSEDEDTNSTGCGLDFSFNLFRNRTEKLLFQQRMCYKVGQMGAISLYDLKHLILLPRMQNIRGSGSGASWNKSTSDKFIADSATAALEKTAASVETTPKAETKRKSHLSKKIKVNIFFKLLININSI